MPFRDGKDKDSEKLGAFCTVYVFKKSDRGEKLIRTQERQ